MTIGSLVEKHDLLKVQVLDLALFFRYLLNLIVWILRNLPVTNGHADGLTDFG